MFLNIFKKTNEHGNYPVPKTKMTDAEKKRREEYNYEILFKEIYVPNTRVEELIGARLTDKNPCVKRSLTNAEIDECQELLHKELFNIMHFGKLLLEKDNPVVDQWSEAKENQLKSLMSGKKCSMPELDFSIYSVPRMKEIYKEAMKMTEKMKEEDKQDLEKEADEKKSETREEKLKRLNQWLQLRPIMKIALMGPACSMCYTHANYYGASVPLYDMH